LGAVLLDDYYNKMQKTRSDRQKLYFSRMSVLISGLLGVLLAMSMTQIKSMADAAFNFVSLVAGGVLGMYALGYLTKRCSKTGLYVGIVTGVLFILWAYFTNPEQNINLQWLPRFPLHTLWIGLLGNIIVFTVGYFSSLTISPSYRADKTLTIYDSQGE
jgi:SSS family solute:Na+ symporter